MPKEDIKALTSLFKEGLQSIQGEIARMTTEVRQLSSRMLHLEVETTRNGKDIARLSSDVENIKDFFGEELGNINNKLDALLSNVIDLQDKAGVVKDQLVGIEEKITENKVEIKVIKKHVGLPATN